MLSKPLSITKLTPGSQEQSRNGEVCAVVSPHNGEVDIDAHDKIFTPASVVDAASKLSRSAHFFSLRLMMQMAEEDDDIPPLEEILEESKPMKGPLPPLLQATSKLSPAAHFFSQRLMIEMSDILWPFDDDEEDTSDTSSCNEDEPDVVVNSPSQIAELLDSILEQRSSSAIPGPRTGKKRQVPTLDDGRKRQKMSPGHARRVTLDLAGGNEDADTSGQSAADRGGTWQ